MARLNEKGQEICSNISLAVTAYLPTMGERIRRYQISPELQYQKYHDRKLWDDEEYEANFDEDGVPLSRHDDVFKAQLETVVKSEKERKKSEKEAAESAEKERKKKFRDDVLSIKNEVKNSHNPLDAGSEAPE